jgi:tRNA(fMet)-specific endonuclease VapC
MKRYLLDTNTVSYLLRGHPDVARHVVSVPMAQLCISAVTKGELLFGLAKRAGARQLHAAVAEFLRRIAVQPWDSESADRYGPVRADLERRGKPLAPLDLMIAAHALSVAAVLVTSDGTFRHVANLAVEDWTRA